MEYKWKLSKHNDQVLLEAKVHYWIDFSPNTKTTYCRFFTGQFTFARFVRHSLAWQ